MYANFWINDNWRKYFKFHLTPETEVSNVFSLHNPYNSGKFKKKADVVLSAQEMFENHPQNILKRKCSQETTSSTPQERSFNEAVNEYNMFQQCVQLVRTEQKCSQENTNSTPQKRISFSTEVNEYNDFLKCVKKTLIQQEADRKYKNNLLSVFASIKKSKLHKKYQEFLEEDFQRHINLYLIADKSIITLLDLQSKAHDEVQRQIFLLLQNDLDTLISEPEDQYSVFFFFLIDRLKYY
jgi:hypothetical protein